MQRTNPAVPRSHVSAMALVLLLCRAVPAGEPLFLADPAAQAMLSAHQDWGQLGLNTAVRPPQGQAQKLRIGDRQYDRGLGQHANGEIAVELGRRFARFEAEIGVHWQGGKTPASVVFQVFIDDEKRFESKVLGENDPPQKVSVSLEGAEEVRLVATDAGDGIHSDAANWVNARLLPGPEGRAVPEGPFIDIARFARVCSSNPNRMEGTRAGRTEEFPAADVFLGKELLPCAGGGFEVPAWPGRIGCIGLEWTELRFPRELILEPAEPERVKSADAIRVELWAGESAWQGKWVALDAAGQPAGNGWSWRVPAGAIPQGTQKVRWLFEEMGRPVPIRRISVRARGSSQEVRLRFESARPGAGGVARIEAYNGELLVKPGPTQPSVDWDRSRPLGLTVLATRPSRYQSERTVLRFQVGSPAPGGTGSSSARAPGTLAGKQPVPPDAEFGVAVEDVVAHGAVWVAHAGVFVTRDPPPVTLDEHLKKIAGRKTVLQRVRELPDQSLAQAIAKVHNPVQDLGPTMLSLACDNRKFVVEREGRVLFDLYERPDAPGPAGEFACVLAPHFGRAKPDEVRRHLDGQWLPLPVTTIRVEGIEYRQRTGVAPHPGPLPEGEGVGGWLPGWAVCVAEFTLENTQSQARQALLGLDLRTDVKKDLRPELRVVPGGVVAVAAGRLVAFVDTAGAGPMNVRAEAGAVTLSGSLGPDQSAQVRVLIPAWKLGADDFRTFQGKAEWAREVESYWRGILGRATQIELPDRLLTNVIRASQVHCLMAARNENRGQRIAAWIASDRYGPLESESQAVIRGMDLLGHQEFARRSLDYFVARYHPSGYITTGYTVVGTGWHLWTLADVYGRSRDRAWLGSVAPKVARACQWIDAQRQKTQGRDALGRELPESGLMPPGVVADWNRYAYRFFADALYYAGLSQAAGALAEVSHPDAARLLKQADDYRRDVLRAYHWTRARSPVVALADGTWVPADPAMLYCFGEVGRFFPGEDWNRTWAGDIEIGAHQLAANGVLDPASEEVGWILDHMEDVQFLMSGMGDYPGERSRADPIGLGGFSKVQPYYTRAIDLYAARDDVKPFVRAYFNAIPSLLSLENLSFWEHFRNQGAWNKTHETGWFLAQTRTMLVMERGDELWLAPLVTDQWLKPGMRISVHNAPTRFGPVGYTITSAVDRGWIDATIDPPGVARAAGRPPGVALAAGRPPGVALAAGQPVFPGSRLHPTPRRIVLRLRHPDGKPIKSVQVDGQPHRQFDRAKQCVYLEPGGKTIAVRVEY